MPDPGDTLKADAENTAEAWRPLHDEVAVPPLPIALRMRRLARLARIVSAPTEEEQMRIAYAILVAGIGEGIKPHTMQETANYFLRFLASLAVDGAK